MAELLQDRRRPRLRVQVSEIHRGPQAFQNLLGALHVPWAGGEAGEVGALGGVALAGGAGRARRAGVSGRAGLPLRAGAPREPILGVARLPGLTWPGSKANGRGSGFSGAKAPRSRAPTGPATPRRRPRSAAGSGPWARRPEGPGQGSVGTRAQGHLAGQGWRCWDHGPGQRGVPPERSRQRPVTARDGTRAPGRGGWETRLLCSRRLLGGASDCT